MGWSSGSSLFANIAEVIASRIVDEDIRRDVYDVMLNEFSNHDCDTLDECYDIDDVLDAALDTFLNVTYEDGEDY